MCTIRVKVKAVLEVFPSIECDDVSQIVVEYPEPGDEFEIDVLDTWSDGILFEFPDGRTTTIAFSSFDVVRDCGHCGLVAKVHASGLDDWIELEWVSFGGPGRPSRGRDASLS